MDTMDGGSTSVVHFVLYSIFPPTIVARVCTSIDDLWKIDPLEHVFVDFCGRINHNHKRAKKVPDFIHD